MQKKKIAKPSGGKIAWVIWSAAAIFYLYEFFVRVSPGVMQDELLEAFPVNASKMGAALASYYYLYSPMQVLVGLLFDRWGGKRLLVPATLFVAVGCFIMAIPTHSLWVLAFSRLLMGFGSAFAFVGVVFLATVWFPPHRIALLSGLTTGLGMLGAIFGEAPLAYWVDSLGWRSSMVWSGLIGIVVSIGLMFAIPNPPVWEVERREKYSQEGIFKGFWKGFHTVVLNPQSWIVGFVGACLYMPLAVFGDLWGVEYIRKVAHVDKGVAAASVSMLYLGWLIGGPVAGWFSDKWMMRKWPMFWGSVVCCVLFSMMLLIQEMSINHLRVLLLVIGLFSSVQVVCFVACIEVNSLGAKGMAIAFANMVVMLVGGVFQPIVGVLMDFEVGLSGAEAMISYSDVHYRHAMMVLPIMMAVGAFTCFFMKEFRQKKEGDACIPDRLKGS